MSSDIVFVSAEASGDELTVEVINHINKIHPNLSASAIGGERLSAVGLRSPIDVSALSVIGLVEGLKVLKTVQRLADEVTDFVVREKAKSVILVDSWGFSIRVAQRIRRRAPSVKIIKLVGPQVWATRPGRAKTLAKSVDHLLCIHDFEVPFYEPFGLQCTVIGNPALHRLNAGNSEAFRKIHGLAQNEDILLILPGSRSSEIKRMGQTFLDAVECVVTQNSSKLRPVLVVSPTVKYDLESAKLNWPPNTIFVEDVAQKADAMAAAKLALASSGTVTTELGTQSCPMVVGYKIGWVTWFIARFFLLRIKYLSLINVVADREIIPEFVQTRFTAKNMCLEASKLLSEPELLKSQISDIELTLKEMGKDEKPSFQVAAEKIAELSI